jgi:hypothetical protein
MTVHITRLPGDEAYDLIFPSCFAKLPEMDQETMQRSMRNSSRVWLGMDGGQVVAVWGLVPPSLLSDRAYLWLYTTEALHRHIFLLIRHSQRAVAEMLKDYPRIVGHCRVGQDKSIRWLRWLGAEFGEPIGHFVPFTIRAKV